MKLYDLEPSGNCYKVRLLCALTQTRLEIVPVDFMAGEHKTASYLDRNAFGELPVLIDGAVTLRDSHAILVYVARKYGGEAWLPLDAAHMAEVIQWLSTSANEVQNGPGAARLVDKFGYAIDKPTTLKRAAALLPVIDAHLVKNEWLAMGRPTIADIAVFPYLALSYEGGIPLDPYPHIRQWIERIKALPHFIPMSGL